MNREDLDKLMTAREAEIYRYVKYLGGDHAVAQDIAQETFLAAYQSPHPPDPADHRRQGAWLRGIARNQFLTYCRRRKLNPVITDDRALATAEAFWAVRGDGEDALGEAREALANCLEELSARNRELLRLRYEEKRSREDMAEALSMGAEGVKTALRRIRSALAVCIEGRLHEEAGS